MVIREIKFPPKVLRRAKPIRVLLMDVDGTITPGYVCLQTFPDSSVAEMKMFNAHDGAGLKLAGIMGRNHWQGFSRHRATGARMRHGIRGAGPAQKAGSLQGNSGTGRSYR
jgi:hypothetical protein